MTQQASSAIDSRSCIGNHFAMKRWLSFLFGIWISVAAFCAEKSSNGLLAKGTKWETTFYQRDSGQPGPVVAAFMATNPLELLQRSRFGTGRLLAAC